MLPYVAARVADVVTVADAVAASIADDWTRNFDGRMVVAAVVIVVFRFMRPDEEETEGTHPAEAGCLDSSC